MELIFFPWSRCSDTVIELLTLTMKFTGVKWKQSIRHVAGKDKYNTRRRSSKAYRAQNEKHDIIFFKEF